MNLIYVVSYDWASYIHLILGPHEVQLCGFVVVMLQVLP